MTDRESLERDLQIADSLVRQQRLNDATTAVLHQVRNTFGTVADELDDLREALGSVSAELARTNARIESLTATVGQLMTHVYPPGLHSVNMTHVYPPGLHSVKVPE